VEKPRKLRLQFLTVPLFFAAGGAGVGVLAWMIGLGNLPNYLLTGVVLSGIGFVFGLVVALHYRFMPVGHLRS
jgi:hypothetical protein